MGATGVGKTALAVELSEEFAGEIVSMDSRQVYRGLDIGTAKPSEEERRRVRHHLIDFLDPSERHSAGRHCKLVKDAARDILSRGRLPFLVGGTGFYFRALFAGLIDASVSDEALREVRRELEPRSTTDLYDELSEIDPARAEQISRNDRVRVMRALEIFLTSGKSPTEHAAQQPPAEPWDGPRFVMSEAREQLRKRIAERTRTMFEQGWAEEVKGLLAAGVARDAPAMNSLGYDTIAAAIAAGHDPTETLDAVVTQTRQYAKRQETFFRGIANARWIDMGRSNATETVREEIRRWLAL